MTNNSQVPTTSAAAAAVTVAAPVEIKDWAAEATSSKNTSVAKQEAQHPAPSSDSSDTINQNGLINGKRNPKQKWVPLEIDLSKNRNKRDRTPRTTRRPAPQNNKNVENGVTNDEDEYYSDRPPRPRRFRQSTSAYRGAKTSSSISRGGRRPGAKASTRRQPPEFSDYPTEYSHANKANRSGDAPPFMMPYMGTFYYNGVPSYANMDTLSMKDAIKKQM